MACLYRLRCISKATIDGFAAVLTALAFTFAANAAGIDWGEPQEATGDADVRTDGVLAYAYCSSRHGGDVMRVNGVPFTASVTGATEETNDRGDIVYDRFTFWPGYNMTDGMAVTDSFTTNYWQMLSKPIMVRYSTCPTVNVTLRHLTPGRRYLVQLWSCGTRTADLGGKTLTIDGNVVLVQNPNDSARLGHFVTGEFTATADTQTFTAKPSLYAFFNAIQVRDISSVPVIHWESSDITADSDVSTEGRLCYAYTQSGADTTVNGVTFVGVSSASSIPAASGMAEVNQSNFIYVNNSVFAGNFTPTETLTMAYKGLVAGAAYDNRGLVNGSITLRNLQPGHAYLVQLWVSDDRNNGVPRYVTLDGDCRVDYHVSSLGQYATGRFRAVTKDQVISLEAGADSGVVGLQWNAIQVRDVTPDIEWGDAVAISDDTCVSTDGELVYAYSYATDAVTVNGVEFSPAGGKCDAMGGDISLAGFRSVASGTDFMTGAVAAGLSQELHDMLAHGAYSQMYRQTRLTLHNLVPGTRYQVQIFAGDRRIGAARKMVVGGSARIAFRDTAIMPFGGCVKGEFTATSTKQEIPLLAMATESSGDAMLTCQIQAVQLRRISGPSVESKTWTAANVISASDVYTTGSLLYAYGFNAATVNGVPFAVATSNTAFGDDATLTSGFGNKNASVFIPSDTLPSLGDYGTLLKGGAYKGTSSGVLTLKNLTAGHRYAVQLWIVDARSTGDGGKRYAVVDGAVTLRFKGEGGLGMYAIGTFVASGATQTVNFTFGTDEGGSVSSQLNAFQVRDLGAVSESVAAEGTVTSELTGSTLVKNGSGTLTLAAAAPNLKRVLLNSGTLVMSAPELMDNALDVRVARGATLQVAAGKTLFLSGLSGEGTVAADGATVALTGVFDGIFSGTVSGDATITKAGGWPAGFAGSGVDALNLDVVGGVLRLFNGDWPGSLGISVAYGAKVELAFEGTNDVERAQLGGRGAYGILSSERKPKYVIGRGALLAPSTGAVVIVR